MANEKRLIDANKLWVALDEAGVFDNGNPRHIAQQIVEEQPTVNAVELPYHPRPMLKDKNPFNTDVYCPECGTNLSGYYGGEPLPIVTCFECGEILDPYKATTKTDGERRTEDQ